MCMALETQLCAAGSFLLISKSLHRCVESSPQIHIHASPSSISVCLYTGLLRHPCAHASHLRGLPAPIFPFAEASEAEADVNDPSPCGFLRGNLIHCQESDSTDPSQRMPQLSHITKTSTCRTMSKLAFRSRHSLISPSRMALRQATHCSR
jgi:hypothetical protein